MGQRRRLMKQKEYDTIISYNEEGVAIFRVSTHGQAKEGWSLQAQQEFIRNYAEKSNIKLVKEFAEEESAKQAGRKVFGEMVTFLKKHKNIKNILVEKTDRLYRNFKDYVILDELGVNIHFIKENTILRPDSRSHDKFIHGIKVLMAKNYIDNLREEIKKGQIQKAKEGYYPGEVVPLGYMQKKIEKKSIMIPDPERAMYVRRAFEIYAQGNTSMRELAEQMNDWGCRTPKGKKITKKHIENMLQNITYTGNFYWGGVYYEGKYKPLVSMQIFKKIEDMNADNRSKRRKKTFLFSGIFQCAKCGRLMTVEKQSGAHASGNYIYLRCSNPACKKHYISESKVEKEVINLLESIRIKPQYVEPIKNGLIELHKKRANEEIQMLKNYKDESIEIKNMLDKLMDKLLNEVISDEQYQTKQSELINRRIFLEEKIKELNKNSDNFNEYVENIFELCKNAPNLYLRSSTTQKQKLLKMILLNPTIDAQKIILPLNSVFEQVGKSSNLIKIGGGGIRTHISAFCNF